MVFQGIATKATAVTPHDDTLLGQTIGLFVGGAGNLTVTMADGNDCVLTGVVAGSVLPLSVKKVKAATTATNIVALYYL